MFIAWRCNYYPSSVRSGIWRRTDAAPHGDRSLCVAAAINIMLLFVAPRDMVGVYRLLKERRKVHGFVRE